MSANNERTDGLPTPAWASTSGIPLRKVYNVSDLPDELVSAGNSPLGSPPYLRGPYPEMYRDRPWRIHQLSGYGDPADMNERLKFLLDAGETGIMIKHDRMTYDHLFDVDHPEVAERREDVGLTGTVAIGMPDYETILEGIPIENVYGKSGGGVVQAAPFTQSCYWSVAQQRGIPLGALSGTGQSDFFLTYLGCFVKDQIPPAAGMRFNLDIIEWCTREMPKWIPVSIPGYNAAESGLNAYQELGAVFANAVAYIDGMQERGSFDVEEFAHKIGGVNFRASMDIFEDAAKMRVARKMWTDLLRERYGVQEPRALRMRIHALTAGSAMTYQEPLNNIVRGTIMAMAGVLGGVQSMGVSGYDEAISVPSDHAHLMSIRIQQILQEEANLRAVADPLGGSYYVESLSAEIEQRAWAFFEEIQEQGGFLSVLESGWLLRHAQAGSDLIAQQLEEGERRVVGVNTHQIGDPIMEVEAFTGRSGTASWEAAMQRLDSMRSERDEHKATAALDGLQQVCVDGGNIIPAVMAAVQAGATIGEVGGVFRQCFGTWQPPVAF